MWGIIKLNGTTLRDSHTCIINTTITPSGRSFLYMGTRPLTLPRPPNMTFNQKVGYIGGTYMNGYYAQPQPQPQYYTTTITCMVEDDLGQSDFLKLPLRNLFPLIASGILSFYPKPYNNLSTSSMVLMVKAPSPSRCRLPPDPPPSKLLSVAFETLTSIIPPEPPDSPDSFFVLVHRLRPLDSFSSDFHSVSLGTLTQAWDFKSPLSDIAINSIGSAVSLRLSYLSNKPCEGIVYVPLWNKSFLRKVHCDVCLLKLYLPQCEDVTLSLTLRMRSSLPL
ncbi:BnaC06g15400D [Brassica napus]|uniref:(rape) hypothetical protein n=1 Tax=Brassica napus TaxID=3708 RepID=A0A078F3J2_BRANA|nr:unnamed protein product [Brassica napus]CDY07524.1 BnaC06g15400D [Brassica napus]